MKLLYNPQNENVEMFFYMSNPFDSRDIPTEEQINRIVRSMTGLSLSEEQTKQLYWQTDLFFDKVFDRHAMEEAETTIFTKEEFVDFMLPGLIENKVDVIHLELIAEAFLLLRSIDALGFCSNNDEDTMAENTSDVIDVLVNGQWQSFNIKDIYTLWLHNQLWDSGFEILAYYYNTHIAFSISDLTPFRRINYDCVVFVPWEAIENNESIEFGGYYSLWVNFTNKHCFVELFETEKMDYSFFDRTIDWEQDFLRKRLRDFMYNHTTPMNPTERPVLTGFHRLYELYKKMQRNKAASAEAPF